MALDRSEHAGNRKLADAELASVVGGILFYQGHQGPWREPFTPAWLHDSSPAGPALSLTPTFVATFFGNPGHVTA